MSPRRTQGTNECGRDHGKYNDVGVHFGCKCAAYTEYSTMIRKSINKNNKKETQ